MKHLLDPELPFWRWVCNVPHMLVLSVIWLVTSLPVITFVPATVALYDVVIKNMRTETKGMYRRYFKTFRAELKQGIPMSLLWTAIAAVFLAGSYVLAIICDTSEIWAFCALAYPLLFIPPVLIFIWAIGIQARFVCTFRKLHENAFGFMINNLMHSLAILGMLLVAVVACAFLPAILSVLPALIAVLVSIPMEKALLPYYVESEENKDE